MNPTRQLRLFLLAWLAGLVLSLFVPAVWSAFGILLGIVLYFLYRRLECLAVAMLFVSAWYGGWYSAQFYPDNLKVLVGQTVELKATVQGEVRVRGQSQTVRLKVQAWRQQQGWQPLSGQILWPRAPLPVLQTGDEVVVSGVVANVSNYSSDFDAKSYWRRWGIEQQLIRSELITRPPPTIARRENWRNLASERLSFHLEGPHLTVALGMLVGLKEKLPKHLDEAFKEAGLQHLLVVSGTNITLLIVALALLLKPLGPWWRYSVGVLVIGTYLYLVGFEPPALRASLFGVITGLALTSGNFCEYRNFLLLVAVGLSVYDPRFVTHDVSFHLSFGATLGMMLGVPWVYHYLKFITWPKVRLLIAASFCAQVAVFPILILQFGSFPYMGLFTNLATEPLVPLIMMLSFGGVMIGDLSFLGLDAVWQTGLWASIEGLIKLAQWASLAPEILMPAWVGTLWSVVLLLFGFWASFSVYYQQHFWEKMEAEISS